MSTTFLSVGDVQTDPMPLLKNPTVVVDEKQIKWREYTTLTYLVPFASTQPSTIKGEEKNYLIAQPL